MKTLIRAAAAALAVFAAVPAAADDLLDQYVAYIGGHDLYNSKGVRLWEPYQILRQDRANFHRFGRRDPMDQGDRFFADMNNRAAMERMLMQGNMPAPAANAIVNGGATVVVKVWGWGNQGRYVTVDVYR
ncbi:hypothetical protein [Rhodovulum adriaticum]|uniref:Uncharacterized protein n=1 Tax=Rhodovulum adriaticum TaxID=35804 RepID=A0A4R2NNJ0_RHOAD|nr:hypothetical protein [Rhodovulum adriaticum]MBK1636356.1 hypothetical protein [Rhodovulum adriaticum]TCP22845.1 hypothetical protein EV656_105147 [Rhodovulum adriaticum]